jgi:putative MFS transporter
LEWLYLNEFVSYVDPRVGGRDGRRVHRIGAAGTYLVPVSLTHFGLAPTMYAGGLITVIGLIACLAWAEETKGRSLAEVSAGTASTPAGARAQTAPAVPRLDR